MEGGRKLNAPALMKGMFALVIALIIGIQPLLSAECQRPIDYQARFDFISKKVAERDPQASPSINQSWKRYAEEYDEEYAEDQGPIDCQTLFDSYAKKAAEGDPQAYWEAQFLWLDHREVQGGPVPVNENLYGKDYSYWRYMRFRSITKRLVHAHGQFDKPRECPEGPGLGYAAGTGDELCRSDVDEVLPYLNDKLRYISKFQVCFPDEIIKTELYEAVKDQFAQAKRQFARMKKINRCPAPPADPRERFDWRPPEACVKNWQPSDHAIAGALSKAFPC